VREISRRPVEWLLTEDGSWEPLPPMDEVVRHAEMIAQRRALNRAVIDASRALCARVRERLQRCMEQRALRTLP
jgi:hypothetical protein